MIPKIIHQTWKTSILPKKFETWHQQVKALHPDWKIILWTDEDNLALVTKFFPDLLEIYNSLQYNIMRADVIRYMYMSVYGGYYLDLDYELFEPFDDKLSNASLLLPISGKHRKMAIIGNSIFGSEPSNIFWKDILDTFKENPPTKKFYDKFEILKLTGPDFISEVYYKNPAKYNATLVHKHIFHPSNSLTRKKHYQQLLIAAGTRGIHHCEGSWLKDNNSFIHYLSRGKASIKRRFQDLFGGKSK
ncbi:hypothetical protein FW778_10740 [Ginsengibacter hankyongi]|uniref:Glycosyl transferase n=1 Tax=Ginsengibacter hankyongi TaxID=2607284 RepID=A0A5J5IJW8_9BACT|nr:glycosyltransferase [Ginsengibacter hankyongi]KAA9039299.1 hypothetical protein FW778_10740 [Ginsengibacter hankyongi]